MAALKTAGCERIYREKASGGRRGPPELHQFPNQLRKGDVLVVWELDRLSRSLRDGRRPKLAPQQQAEIRRWCQKATKRQPTAPRLFKIHPATVSQLLTRAPRSKIAYAK